MTTQDVIQSLLDAGWRYERLGTGLEPVLTNTPEGQNFCIQCSEWLPACEFIPSYLANECKSCSQAIKRKDWAQTWRERNWHGYRRPATA